MRSNSELFELWILSRMRNELLFSEVLRQRQLSEFELDQLVREFADRVRIEELGPPGDLYQQLLGAPAHAFAMSPTTATNSFANSTTLWFAIPMLPDVFWETNVSRTGMNWAQRFTRRRIPGERIERDADPQSFAMLCKPWSTTLEEAKCNATKVELIDAWSWDFKGYFSFSSGQNTVVYLGDFEYELLQTWVRVD